MQLTNDVDSDIDFGTMSLRARFDLLEDQLTDLERGMELGFSTGQNWGIISQEYAISLGHVDSAGVRTAIAILDGMKYWAIRKTALEGHKEMDVDDFRWFVELGDRDLESLPGGKAAWVALVLYPGDVL